MVLTSVTSFASVDLVFRFLYCRLYKWYSIKFKAKDVGVKDAYLVIMNRFSNYLKFL